MTAKTIGYARTAVVQGDIDIQIEKLKVAGCTEIFSDSGFSGTTLKRPSLKAALSTLRAGDKFTVCAMNRISRSSIDLMRIVDTLMSKGVELEVVDEPHAARMLQDRVNYAPDPSPDKSSIRYAMFQLGKFLVRRSRIC